MLCLERRLWLDQLNPLQLAVHLLVGSLPVMSSQQTLPWDFT